MFNGFGPSTGRPICNGPGLQSAQVAWHDLIALEHSHVGWRDSFASPALADRMDGGSIPVILGLLAAWDKVDAAGIDDSESSRRSQQRIRGDTMPNQDVEEKVNEVLQKLSPEDANLIIQATVTKVLDQIKDSVFQQAFDSPAGIGPLL